MSHDPFHVFAKAVAKRLAAMQKKELLQCNMARIDVWEAYLGAFPAGTDPVYKTETEHTCNSCRSFIKQLGNIAIFENGRVKTLWHGLGKLPAPYDTVAATLAEQVADSGIEGGLKADSNVRAALMDANGFGHFHGTLDAKYWRSGSYKDALDSRIEALEKLSKVPVSALESVKDLITENQIYRGAEFRVPVNKVLAFVKKMQGKPASALYGETTQPPHFLGSVIGTLVSSIADGMPIEDAVRRYESMVAPSNYKRPKPVISQKMVEKALAKVATLGLTSALNRRIALIEDISVSNVDWVNVDTQAKMKGGNPVEDLLMASTAPPGARLTAAVPVSMGAFLSDILPKADEVDLYVENAQVGNLVALTAPKEEDPSDKALFDWDNSFGWSYAGNVTDSIKERVKRAGGAVDGLALRVSLAWTNYDDLDLHARTPNGEVSFRMKKGILDVDMNVSCPVSDPVENMAFRTLPDGNYVFRVHNYTRRHRGGEEGFSLEVQIGKTVRTFTVPTNPRHGGWADEDLAITVKNGVAVITRAPGVEGSASRKVWNVDTETFVPVGAVLRSPNHWDGNAKGNKHWFFVLKGCVPEEPVAGIYNEFLRSDLRPHRKVFEVLSRKALCQPEEGSLCGLGFSTTRKDVVRLRVKAGASTRLYDVTIDA